MSFQQITSTTRGRYRFNVPANGTYILTNGLGEQEIITLSIGDTVEFDLVGGKATMMLLDSGYGIESGSVEEPEEIRPSIEQCSVCAKKFDLPKNLKGPQRLIPVHVELFNSRCKGSGQKPKN